MTVDIRRVPGVGDAVYWAKKEVGLQITRLFANPRGEMIAELQGGAIIKNKTGRQVPRWTVQSKVKYMKWDADLGMWFVGQGPRPRAVNGIIILPDAVVMSGTSKGSFAVS
jgi:hypothetical protein